MFYKFFKFLAKISLTVSFWLLTFASKSVGAKALYKIDELEEELGFDVHFRWYNND